MISRYLLLPLLVGTTLAGMLACRDTPTAPSARSASSAVMASTVSSAAANGADFTREFRLADCDFSTVGDNPFFPLKPGLVTVLEGVVDGTPTRLQIRVLHRTIAIGGLHARVVEEREEAGGELAEVSLNYFAQCKQNGTVFYFGEDVDFYENGRVVSHEGSWRHGVKGANAGVIMPGIALIGSRYFQEIAPGIALDRAEVLDVSASVDTPLRRFGRALLTEETTPLDPEDVGRKLYAAGIGLVADEALRLVRVSGR